MIAVSTFRPHKDSEDYRRNQIVAKRSWEPIFERIIYLGDEEPELASEKTEFRKSEDFPRIREMAAILAEHNGLGCWINADIILTPTILEVEQDMIQRGMQSTSSKRYMIQPPTAELEIRLEGDVTDNGIDIFIGTQKVWIEMAEKVPYVFRVSNYIHDTWMIGFLNYAHGCRDFTSKRCVFHPIHEGRKAPFQQEVADYYNNNYGSEYFRHAGQPPDMY